ncbi:hypothetical protein [Bradyrhizobium sp. JR3.5]
MFATSWDSNVSDRTLAAVTSRISFSSLTGERNSWLEIQNADDDVRCYIAEKFKAPLGHEELDHFLEGNIKGPEGRVDIVRERFVTISQSDAGEREGNGDQLAQ